jgi:hypothetical protein
MPTQGKYTDIFVVPLCPSRNILIQYLLLEGAGIATGYEPEDRGVGVRVPIEPRIFFSPRCPDQLWGPFSLLSNGYRGLLPGGKAVGA